MKLVTYATDEEPRLGLLQGERVVDLARASQGQLPADMRAFLNQGEAAMSLARQVAESKPVGLPVEKIKLLAPILNPSKVVAIGLNYMDHCREQKVPPPESVVVFTKFSTAIIGPGETIRWDPTLTSQVDYEAELAVVIGRPARRVSASDALDCVAGYTNGNDVSARDLQFSDEQWVRGKSLDSFCPLGPWLVTRDEIPNPQALTIRATVNGEVLQDSNTSEMIFGVSQLIETLSAAFTLLPGDVIMTGTPHGVGVFREPQVFLSDGATATIEIEGLGALTNHCVEESL